MSAENTQGAARPQSVADWLAVLRAARDLVDEAAQREDLRQVIVKTLRPASRRDADARLVLAGVRRNVKAAQVLLQSYLNGVK
jgi:hypothetical protein